MLIVKEDKTRPENSGQIFVELTRDRGLDVANCDRLGYWCDKLHLKHFIFNAARMFDNKELIEIFAEIITRRNDEPK
ncbi:hypothetical protein [Bacteroides pyogenes]|uniref:hypothetical protein n=1 Tax=Bacteroides pyogenes TaxID=310300 RepID=UPI001BAB82DF|nr:hypothetical protein [Bacteroides pyogenes]MBR8707174.1 hypothetical protein [Bacteroides pyogenes]